MHPLSGVVIGTLLLALPGAAFADVAFGRVKEIYPQTCWPDGLKAALESHPRIDGTSFTGWGLDQIELFYEGDAAAFTAFVASIDRVQATHVGRDGQICPVEFKLMLAPGRGQLYQHTAKLHQIPEPFEYDWSILVTLMYSDDAGRAPPFVATVTDSQGQPVKRRIFREKTLTPNLRIQITRFVEDGTSLADANFPRAWLFDEVSESRPVSSLFLKRPQPDDVDPEQQKDILLAGERIERFLNRERYEMQRAQAAWRISDFYGITIDLGDDLAGKATVVATYDGAATRFDVQTGRRVNESEWFPPTAASLVECWLEARRTEVLRQWQAALDGEPIEMVDPLE